MMKNNKILIVGCGISGIVIARQLAEEGYKVMMIDQRNHIGGNCYDYINEFGIRIHKYGPHLFHTNKENVIKYLSRFTFWIPYKHKVKGILADGTYCTIPVNKETKQIVGEKNVLDIFFRPYSRKMWDKELEELDPSVIKRVPIRDDDNEFYFPNDTFQAMPSNGYTKMFESLLDHKNIKVKLSTKFLKKMEKEYDYIFNSIPIDVYHKYKYGKLEYRSIKFTTVNIPMPKVLPVTTVNFTHNGKHSRVTEWKNISNGGKNSEMTTLTYEEPCDYKDNNFERYYPVKDLEHKNLKRYVKYKNIETPKMKFIGRCGMYVYINMDEAVNHALACADEFLKNKYDYQLTRKKGGEKV